VATNWEYRIEQPPVSSPKDLTALLNKLGSEGWELVGVFSPLGNATAYYFKRPVATQAAAQSNFGR
jgi:hypothetical protein